MGISKALISSILLLLLVLHLVDANHMVNTNEGAGYPTPTIDCGADCTARCQLSSRPNLCHRACGTCRARCSCAPTGTSGHLELCPCYAKMTTHDGRRKCT